MVYILDELALLDLRQSFTFPMLHMDMLCTPSPRCFPYYFDLIWYLTPHSRRFKRDSDLVHKFAMDIITKRKKELEEGVGAKLKAYKELAS